MDGSFGEKRIIRRKRKRALPSQVPMPAQEPSILDPYYVSEHIADAPADQIQLIQQYLEAPYEIGEPPTRAFVISHYDARPINAHDQIFTFTATEQEALIGQKVGSFSYKVPPGRVLIARTLLIQAWFASTPFAATGAPTLTLLTASFRINGGAVPGHQNMNLQGALQDATVFRPALQIPLYFIAVEGETVQLIVTSSALNFAYVAPVFHTNMLLASGINRTSEPATQVEIPIKHYGP